MLNLGCIFEVRLWLTVVLILDRKVLVNLENFDQFLSGDKNISSLHLSCRTSDFQFFTHPANTCYCPLKSICNKVHKGVI